MLQHDVFTQSKNGVKTRIFSQSRSCVTTHVFTLKFVILWEKKLKTFYVHFFPVNEPASGCNASYYLGLFELFSIGFFKAFFIS